ncbi:hypothetical protein [Nonomuraea sp. NPDC050202]|uniref:hypothetical protein n=1 Tax=Nonomuraea sp. NPDC050202 TaxID=3155035 RepID=UPI00340EA3FB
MSDNDEAYRANAYRVARVMKTVATKADLEARARNLDAAGKHVAAEIFREVASE